MSKFEILREELEQKFPGWEISFDGYWETPVLSKEDLRIWLDQCTPAISFANRSPRGWRMRGAGDGWPFRLNVAKNGDVEANIYGLCYNAESLPDLLARAKELGAIEAARKLFEIPCPVNGHKWFVAPERISSVLPACTPEEHEAFIKSLRSLRDALIG